MNFFNNQKPAVFSDTFFDFQKTSKSLAFLKTAPPAPSTAVTPISFARLKPLFEII